MAISALIPFLYTSTVNKDELWEKLDADSGNESIQTDIKYYTGENGYIEFKNNVMGKLEDGMSYEDACRVYEEENDKF